VPSNTSFSDQNIAKTGKFGKFGNFEIYAQWLNPLLFFSYQAQYDFFKNG